MTAPLVEPKESAKAYQAFVDYVNLGPTRSLRKLVEHYHKNPTYLTQLRDWSVDYNWQERLKQLAAEQLSAATELKTSTYVKILDEYHRRVDNEPMRKSMQLTALHGIYDRVKPETPQTSVVLGKVDHTIHFVFEEATGRED